MLYEGVVTQTCTPEGVCTDAPGTWVTSKQFYAGLGVAQVRASCSPTARQAASCPPGTFVSRGAIHHLAPPPQGSC
jgi:hypothetical protein